MHTQCHVNVVHIHLIFVFVRFVGLVSSFVHSIGHIQMPVQLFIYLNSHQQWKAAQ
jgi:hypothetical protein